MKNYYIVCQDKPRDKLEIIECPTFENLNEVLHRINKEEGHILCVVHGVQLVVEKNVTTSFTLRAPALPVPSEA